MASGTDVAVPSPGTACTIRGLKGKLTMSGKGRRASMMANRRVKRGALMALVFLGVLPLPIIAYALGAYVVTRTGGGAPARDLLSSQVLLFFIAVLVAGLGGLLIRTTASSLGRTTVVRGR